MLTHRGYTSWVVSDGQHPPVYEIITDEAAHRVTCWIPSEAGKTFEVHWRDDLNSGVSSAGYINIDGYVVPGRFLYGHGATHRAGVRTGGNRERPFMFVELEDPDRPLFVQHTKEVVTIMLKIKLVHTIQPKTANLVQPVPPPAGGPRRHCATFGQARETFEQHNTTWDATPYDLQNPGSYVTFVFRYRSWDFLKDNGILSGSHLKPPPPLPSAPIAHNQPLPQVAPSPTPLDIPSSSEQVTPRQYAPLGDIEMKTPSRALFDLDALLAAPSVLFGSSSMSQSSTDMEIFTLPVLPFNRTITPIPIASPSLSQTISPFTTPLMPTDIASLADIPKRSARKKTPLSGIKPKRIPRSERLAPGEIVLRWGSPEAKPKGPAH